MKIITTFIVLIFLVPFYNKKANNGDDKPSTSLVIKNSRSLNDTPINKTRIKEFLEKPFDLYEFKKKKGASNSGGAYRKKYFYEPPYQGVYYSFFMFGKNNCFIGRDTLRMENSLLITTCRPKGKLQDQYLNPDEELLYLEASCNDFDLPQLAFIGLDTSAVKDSFGAFAFKKQNYVVYTHQNNALILGISGHKIIWLKYVRLKKELDPKGIYEGLYSLD